MDTDSISIIIVDNHRLIREGLRSLLAKYKDIEVVGDTDYKNVSEVIKTLKPKIVLLSLIANHSSEIINSMSDLGLALSGIQFLILTQSVEDQNILKALKLGALGCLLSDSSTQDLVDSIYELAREGSYLSSQVGRKLLQNISSSMEEKENGLIILSPQQMRVMKLISSGHTNQEIADVMNLSKRTVEMHIYRLFRRLNVSSRTQAVQVALRLGLIEMSEGLIGGEHSEITGQ